jgi:hypothetical protein
VPPVLVEETPSPTVTVTRTPEPEPEPEETKEADLFGFLSGWWNFSFPKLW